jgi:alpha-L-fucosidase
MTKEKLSQQTLLEVLTREIETMKAATKLINEVAPAVNRKLNEVKDLELKASINPNQINQMEAIFKRYLSQLNKKLPERILFLKWLFVSLLIAFFSFAASVGYNIYQKNEYNSMKETAQYWYDTAVEYGYESKN